MKKTPWNRFEHFSVRYWVENDRIGNPGHLRLGQAFMNEFYPEIADPEVYYETDNNAAWLLIVERYVEGGTGVLTEMEGIGHEAD